MGKEMTPLERLQKATGDWGKSIPFYQTVNALAHLKSPKAKIQLEKAFVQLFETQTDDGSWSCSEPEWNTFLTIHALKNKGRL